MQDVMGEETAHLVSKSKFSLEIIGVAFRWSINIVQIDYTYENILQWNQIPTLMLVSDAGNHAHKRSMFLQLLILFDGDPDRQ